MANIISTCTWVLANGKPCGERCRWGFEIDDDGNRRRTYQHFCPDHMPEFRAFKERDERLDEEWDGDLPTIDDARSD